jgi:hypothetical protein
MRRLAAKGKEETAMRRFAEKMKKKSCRDRGSFFYFDK